MIFQSLSASRHHLYVQRFEDSFYGAPVVYYRAYCMAAGCGYVTRGYWTPDECPTVHEAEEHERMSA